MYITKKTWVAKYPGQQPPRKIIFSDILKDIGGMLLVSFMGLALMIMMVIL